MFVNVVIARTMDERSAAPCAICRRRLRSIRSAIVPPSGAIPMTATPSTSETTPTAKIESVRSWICQRFAAAVAREPICVKATPSQNRRKPG